MEPGTDIAKVVTQLCLLSAHSCPPGSQPGGRDK